MKQAPIRQAAARQTTDSQAKPALFTDAGGFWRTATACAAVLGSIAFSPASHAQTSENKVLNLYSARHYQTDEALYNNFTQATGITIRRIELGDEALLERLRNEGSNSQADVILLVDAARLWKLQIEGLSQPVKSKILDERIPVQFRAQEGQWFGFSSRARVIVYNKDSINPADVQNYEDLANPKLKGKVCTRSGSHPYMLSLMGAMVEHLGADGAEKWAKSVVDNMARPPKGGDTDQIKGVASGECGVALTNTYYWVRLLRSDKPEDKAIVSKVGFIWPNQQKYGTHINISGGAVAKYAPNRQAAIQFLEYLSSKESQAYFADGNNEWPVVKGVKLNNTALSALGSYKEDPLPAQTLARNTVTAQRILDKVGYR
jgi:iron(III) transport system substrate-binding protein